MKRKFIKISVYITVSLVSAFVFTYAVTLQNMQNSFDSELYDNVIRLHILADSDSEKDQKAKLAVRDGVKDYIYTLVSEAENKDEADIIIKNNLQNIENKVKDTVSELGYTYKTQVFFENEYYPVRYYEGFAFPSGDYKSLKITLGSGEGKNWWCVLYPTVCNSMATDVDKKLKSAGISENTAKMICSESKEYEYGLYILELFKRKK
ncbi:MAG: hypothetical protein E7621_03650 [Ruminococcaceae bacterium]|nr:hypothetical protein [Oscillospiraceae bacterium]